MEQDYFDEVTGISFPFFQGVLYEMFGDPRDQGFKNDHLGFIDLRDFMDMLGGLDSLSQGPYFGLFGNWIMEGPLHKALWLVRDKALGSVIQSLDCYCDSRLNGRAATAHAYGLALLINARNPRFSSDFISCFAQAGFEWGGLWGGGQHLCHFQLPWTQEWQPGSRGVVTPVAFVR
jgi:hypothetical protein